MRALALLLALAALPACGDRPAPTGEATRPEVVIARVGSPLRPAVTRPERSAAARKLATRTRNAIGAAEPFEVEVPAAATRLAFSLACVPTAEASGCPDFQVELREADGEGRPLFQGPGDGDWADREAPLPPADRRRLRFSLAGAGGAEALWGSLLLLGPPADATPRPDIVLVSLDTLGAASLGSFSGRSGDSPRIDALLAESADFRRAYAQYGNTLVSHASLFSALYPRRHGIYPGVMPGPIEASLVGELARAGYRTVAFTEGAFVSAAFGFAEGFDAYDDGMLGLSNQMAGGAAQTFERASDWLRSEGRRGPHFLFLHTYEVHSPYLPRDEAGLAVAASATPDDPRAFPAELQARKLLNHNSGREPLSDRDLDRLRALHLGEVNGLDRVVGDFLDELEALGLARDTLLVLTADHGDQFGEWGKVGHGDSLHDRVLHVPLAFRWPGRIEPRRIPAPVQLVDVMPTLLELVGLPLPARRDGASLAAAIRGGHSAPRPAFAEQRTGRGECARLGLGDDCRLDRISVHSDHWKLVASRLPPWRRLYDLETDPLALRDVADLHPEVTATLAQLADAYRQAADDGDEGETGAGSVDPDTLRRLRELGYVDFPEADPTGPPSPEEPF